MAQYKVEIHAWVLMTNHVHLLATPREELAVSKMMQSLGRHYVRYFNQSYGRSGTLWEGRFKSCLVQSKKYLLECYRYIELNPVRAGMVEDPADYVWSSYRSNALGVPSNLITPHEEYLALGESQFRRLLNYQNLFLEKVDSDRLKDITESLEKGLVLGSERFKTEVEDNLKRKARLKKVGRKPGEMLLCPR